MHFRRPTIVGGRARTTLLPGLLAASVFAVFGWVQAAIEPPPAFGEVVVLNDNGAWSWFEDERAVIDPDAGTLLASSVANAAGTGGAARHGNVEVATLDVATGGTGRTVLHPNLQGDDHDSAALLVRADGRYVAMYSRHDTDGLTRWRVSEQAADATAWGPERTLDHRVPATYANLYAGGDGEPLHAFVRSDGRDPTILVSADQGATWRDGGRLLDGPGRPYVRYAADNTGQIHLIATEQHPADVANGIHHGVVDRGRLLRSDGTVVDGDLLDQRAVRPEQLTTVFPSGVGRAWAIDLQIDAAGHPYAAFSVHAAGDVAHYYYARFDGTAWHVHRLADAGTALSPGEPFYTGLVALHPHDPSRLFISTDVDPTTGAPLVSAADGQRHHEIFEGVTADDGTTWTWHAVTSDSADDNIRPIVPIWDTEHTALLWLRGTYRGYQDYDLDVVASIDG